MNYTHLNLEDRYYIECSIKHEKSLSQIAKELCRSYSTILREVTRNKGKRGYRYKQAHGMAMQRHTEKHKAVKLTPDIQAHINLHLEDDWSPEQIAGYLKKEVIITLHHETIYQYILADKRSGGTLYTHLRHQNKTYRKRYGSSNNSRSGIVNRRDIDERPAIVNRRKRVGDWEGDTVIGKAHKGALVTLDERKSKLRLARPVRHKTALEVHNAMTKMLSPIKRHVKTVTFDNGKEFALHEQLADSLSCDVYFAKPYHSWERGQNENANGLLRQYFPKSMELVDVTLQEVFAAVHKLNSRPRKCLGYKTPYEVFEKLTGITEKQLIGYALMS